MTKTVLRVWLLRDEHFDAEDDEGDGENFGEDGGPELVHEVGAPPGGDGCSGGGDGYDAPVDLDQCLRSGVVECGDEGGDYDDGERGGDGVFVLHAECCCEGWYHDDATADSAERAEETCGGSYDEGDDDGFHGEKEKGERIEVKGAWVVDLGIGLVLLDTCCSHCKDCSAINPYRCGGMTLF